MTNEEILNTFANKMLESVNAIEAFGKEQIPDYVNQLLQYEFWRSFMLVTACILFFLFFIFVIIYCVKRIPKSQYYEGLYVFGVALCFLALTVLSLAIFKNLGTIFKIKLAPKVYIVDKLQEKFIK